MPGLLMGALVRASRPLDIPLNSSISGRDARTTSFTDSFHVNKEITVSSTEFTEKKLRIYFLITP